MFEDQSVIVTGLYFGDEGKGSWTEFFATQHPTKAVVRTSGGAQAAHNIVTDAGLHHTFAQFTAGTLSGIPTILTKHMMVEPYALAKEGQSLSMKLNVNVFPLLTISENSLVTTPVHGWVNRTLEDNRGSSRHGSTGLGIGETTRYSLHHPETAIRMVDIKNPRILKEKFNALVAYAEERTGQKYTDDVNRYINDYSSMLKDGVFGKIISDADMLHLLSTGRFVFEGSQGVLLDEDLGFHPHTTWSRTTSANARELLQQASAEPAVTVGLVRKYGTRHGAGPFPGEFVKEPEVSLPEPHNGTGEYQGHWRTGYLALPLVEYAVRANQGIDFIAVSHWDVNISTFISGYENFPYIPTDFFAADRELQQQTIKQMMNAGEPEYSYGDRHLLERLTEIAHAPVVGVSQSPTSSGKLLF